MIKSFKDKDTQKIYSGIRVSRYSAEIQRAALRKLKYLNQAVDLTDLRVPPGNHLEALTGRNGYYSIRINDQWRITFSWADGAENVQIEDYH